MNEIDQLRLELAGANAQIETYRLREFACYQALGYSQPTNDALPFLISKEREDRIGLEKQLKSALDKLDAAERALKVAEQHCADRDESLAVELSENLALFNLLGLKTAADFGNDTSTAALRKRIVTLIEERDTAKRACAEMREALEMWRPVREQILTKTNTTKAFDHAMSSDCGKDFVPRAELDKLKEQIKVLCKNSESR